VPGCLFSYTHVMKLDGDERERLRALVEGAHWAAVGSESENGAPDPSEVAANFRP
jgi:hypothetical protein